MNPEIAKLCGKLRVCFLFHKALLFQSAANDLFDGNHSKPVLPGKPKKFRGTHHGTIFSHDLTAETAFFQPRQFHEIHRRFCVSRPFEDAALSRLQRKHMPWSPEILWSCSLFHGFYRRQRSLKCRDSRRSIHVINGYRKRGGMVIRIYLHHLVEPQLFTHLLAHGHTDQPLCQTCHGIHIFRRGMLCRTDQVSLIFPLRVINHKDQFPIPQIL